jgi:phosphoglycerate dehydrogenase-like enzyme
MTASTDAAAIAAATVGDGDGATTTSTAPPPPFRVLFCGPDMAYGHARTAAALAADATRIQVVQARSREEGVALLPTADLAVPLMTVLPGPAIAAAAAASGQGGRLRTILQFGVGLEGVDVGAAASAGVAVRNIPSRLTRNAAACSEMALLLALGLLRRLPECAAGVAARTVGGPPGRTLTGKRALVIGFGGIAAELVPRLAALGVTVDAVRRSPWDGGGGGDGGGNDDDDDAQLTAAAALLDRRGRLPADLPSLASSADLVFLALPLTPSTAGLVGRDFWETAAKPGTLVINVCRGGLVCPDAALEALESGRAGGLGLDVTWEEPVPPAHPLARHPRVIITPHVAGVTEESYGDMADIVAGVAREMVGEEEEGRRRRREA